MTKHLDINFDHAPTPAQVSFIKAQFLNNSLFSDHAIYINGDYIGGRPNDR